VLKEYNDSGEGNQDILKAIYVSERVGIERLMEAARLKGLSLLEFITVITEKEVSYG